MNASKEALKELMGEHEAIMAYMRSMTDSVVKLAAQPANACARLWNYRCRLYDFKDAIWYHLETDERVFKSVLGDAYDEDPIEEHREIQRLVSEMVTMADNTVIEKLGQAEVAFYCEKLGDAFNRICRLVQLHIAREDSILERVQRTLNHN